VKLEKLEYGRKVHLFP